MPASSAGVGGWLPRWAIEMYTQGLKARRTWGIGTVPGENFPAFLSSSRLCVFL